MNKIIINNCYGGYNWSEEALKILSDIKGISPYTLEWEYDLREDSDAIALIEERGSEFCSGECAELIVEEYDGDKFIADISEYDGWESLHLIPRFTEAMIRACSSIDEVVDLIKSLNLFKGED